MYLLSDIITYIRRIIKSPSDAVITDVLIIDYINRFWLNDVDARIQLFDLKTKYQFVTIPGVDKYNMPLYGVQTPNAQTAIEPVPVYQGFMGPAYVNGVQIPFYTERSLFQSLFPNFVNNLLTAGTGDGSAGPYDLVLPYNPNSSSTNLFPLTSAIIRGHVDLQGIMAKYNAGGTISDPPLVSDGTYIPLIPGTSVSSAVFFTSVDSAGNNVVVQDSGLFLDTNVNCGLLMAPNNTPSAYPFGNAALSGGYSATTNTINYALGTAQNVTFPTSVADGQPIMASCIFYQLGLPRAVLFYDNVLTLRVPPDRQYVVELDAYLTPAAFLNSDQAIQFGYMTEYIARGAARKILSDVGDWEQFNAYEPLFQEQEMLVWKRSSRQKTATRTPSIYSARGYGMGGWGNGISGGV